MKSIIKSSLLLCAGVALFAACDKDLEHNPTLQTPKSFVLNAPAYAAQTVDLKTSGTLNFTWSQPEYGFPAAAEYGMQFSTTDHWTKSVDQVVDMDTERGDYAAVGTPTGTCRTSVNAADIATAIQKMERYEEGHVPTSQTLYARAYSLLNGDTIYSNSVKMSVAPYYIELSDAPVETWYLVGGSFGDFVYNDGGSSDIKVPTAGYYTITFDTKNLKLKIVPYTGTAPTVYTSMALPGKHDGWTVAGGTPMTAETSVVENHDWKATVTFAEKSTGADGEGCKFAANGTWDVSWGAEAFPYGVATKGGQNIHNQKGTYTVYFNDITGQYSFVKR